MSLLIEEKEVELAGKKFIISKFKAFIGVEIMTQVPQLSLHTTFTGKYPELQRLMVETLKHAAIVMEDGKKVQFETKEQIEAHCSPADVVFLQKEIWGYNVENFPIADVFGALVQEIKEHVVRLMPTFTHLLQRLLKKD